MINSATISMAGAPEGFDDAVVLVIQNTAEGLFVVLRANLVTWSRLLRRFLRTTSAGVQPISHHRRVQLGALISLVLPNSIGFDREAVFCFILWSIHILD